MRTQPYETLDGSLVTELIRPETDGSEALSLAEAVVVPGCSTRRHLHHGSEEVYYVLAGLGLAWISARAVELRPGEACLIRAGEEHNVTCLGEEPLRLLCACSPPYRHEATTITEPIPA